LVRGCVVQAPAYNLSLNYAGCLTSSVSYASVVLSFFLKALQTGYNSKDEGKRELMLLEQAETIFWSA